MRANFRPVIVGLGFLFGALAAPAATQPQAAEVLHRRQGSLPSPLIRRPPIRRRHDGNRKAFRKLSCDSAYSR